jgi:hypothetical protein
VIAYPSRIVMKNYRRIARRLLKKTLKWNENHARSPKVPFICLPHSHYEEVVKTSRYFSNARLNEHATSLRIYMESAGYVKFEEHWDRITACGIDFAESTVFTRHQYWFGIALGASLSFFSALILFVLNRYAGKC